MLFVHILPFNKTDLKRNILQVLYLTKAFASTNNRLWTQLHGFVVFSVWDPYYKTYSNP